jgi:hypothetical protein
MFLIPYRQVVIHSANATDSIANRLSEVTAPYQPWFKSLYGKFDFIGSVSASEFHIVPVIRGRYTYLPTLHGRMNACATGGTDIKIVERLHPLAIVLLLFFLFGPLMFGGTRREHLIWLLIYFLFHSCCCVVAFLPAAHKAEDRIRQLVE